MNSKFTVRKIKQKPQMACSVQTRMNVNILTGTLNPFKTLIFSLEKSVQSRFYAIKFIFSLSRDIYGTKPRAELFKKNPLE